MLTHMWDQIGIGLIEIESTMVVNGDWKQGWGWGAGH